MNSSRPKPEMPRNEKFGPAEPGPVAKVFAVLRELARREGSAGLSELAQALDLPKATVHRVLAQLERLGLVQRMPGERRLLLAPPAIELATEILEGASRTALRRAALVSLSEQTGESCSLGARSGYEIVYLDDVTGSSPLSFHFQRGRRAPLHCTSMGKIYLGKMSPDELDRFFETETLVAYTPWTIVDRDRLRAISAEAARNDFVTSNQEFVLGVVGAAVPVFDSQRRMIAGLAVSIPAARMPYEKLPSLKPLLRKTADRIAASFA